MKKFSSLQVQESWLHYNGIVSCRATDPLDPNGNDKAVYIDASSGGLSSDEARTYNVYDFPKSVEADFYTAESTDSSKFLVDDFVEKLSSLKLLGTVSEEDLDTMMMLD